MCEEFGRRWQTASNYAASNFGKCADAKEVYQVGFVVLGIKESYCVVDLKR